MFEKLSIRNQRHSEAPLDLGAMVEGLLFYGQTEVILTSSSIRQLARVWSPEGLVALLDSGYATFRYEQSISGMYTEHTGTNRERYRPVVFEVSDSQYAAPKPELLIERVLYEVSGRRGYARRMTNQICRRVALDRLDSGITDRVISDLLLPGVAEVAVKRMLQVFIPQVHLPEETRFEVQQVDDGLRVLSNIDFATLNSIYSTHTPVPNPLITPAFLLVHFITARQIMEEAVNSGADMAVDVVNSAVASIFVENVVARRDANEARLSQFQEFILEDGRAIRDAVNAGEISLPEVLKLLKKAEKFKSWMRGRPPETDLVKEYFKAVTAESWADKLPSKSLRWLLFSGIGIVADGLGAGGLGTITGLATGAIDTFLLDSLIKGWKPHQFVHGVLRPLVSR